jgi:hypothetical protein
VTAGYIVTVEPNKTRAGIIVGSPQFFGSGLPFEIVVPLTGEAELAITGASLLIVPTSENGCSKPYARLTQTPSHITDDELARIREQIAACVQAR